MNARRLVSASRRLETVLAILGLGLVLPWILATLSSHHLEAEARELIEADGSPAERDGPLADRREQGLPARGALIGLIEVPALGISAPVLEGADDRILFRAAGHLTGTALPWAPGNVAIAAHRDSHFRALERIAKRDRITLKTAKGVYQYEVDGIDVTAPDDLSVLDDREQPSLTLITCYPFRWVGPAPRRFVVQARLVSGRLAGFSSGQGSSPPRPGPGHPTAKEIQP